MSDVFYLDPSAVTKLVVPEAESSSLIAFISEGAPRCVASELLVTELLQAVQRHPSRPIARAHNVLKGISLISPNTDTLSRAGGPQPPALRSLDSLHLATALAPGIFTHGIRNLRRARAGDNRAARTHCVPPRRAA